MPDGYDEEPPPDRMGSPNKGPDEDHLSTFLGAFRALNLGDKPNGRSKETATGSKRKTANSKKTTREPSNGSSDESSDDDDEHEHEFPTRC